ncbi:MAG TPA: hypothetical protein PLY80_21110, partial [Pseudomonadota bacterium]|nr:hypothetical protein [Pseudomonadota bacterium]
MRGLSVFALLALCASACVTAPPYRGGKFTLSQPLILTADERGYDAPQPEVQPLQSGQVMALSLSLDQAAYVYVLQRRGGVLDSVYETPASDGRHGPGQIRIPRGDSYLRVPSLSRDTRLCVLLAAEPIDAQKRACPFERQHLTRQSHPPAEFDILVNDGR